MAAAVASRLRSSGRSPVHWLRKYAAEAYFFLYNGAIVFILPYLAILWRSEGLTGSQIGILSAIRPFTCSISGQLLVGVADAKRWHLGVTVVTFIITAAARSAMALAHGFAAHLLLIIASEACQSPFSIMTDAAIAASTTEAGYGRKRVLASLGWGALAPLSGWIVGRWGVPRSIAVYLGLVCAAFLPTLLLPLSELGSKAVQASEGEAAGSGDGAAAGKLGRRKTAQHLERGSAMALLAGAVTSDLGGLDSRQHNGHAAELAIELFEPASSAAGGAAAPEGEAARAPEGPGAALIDRLNSKLAQAEAAGVLLHPLVTTADEDAASEAAASLATVGDAAAATPTAPGQPPADGDSWSVAAVGGSQRGGSLVRSDAPALAAAAAPTGALAIPQRRSLQPPAAGLALPGGYGGGGASALARTTSAATTAFFSVASGASMAGSPGSLLTPRGGGGGGGEVAWQGMRSSLVQRIGEAAATPRSGAAGPDQGALLRQGSLQRQDSLQPQLSNLSQALNGFEIPNSPPDSGFVSPRSASVLPQPGSPLPASPPLPALPVQGQPASDLEAVKAGLLGLPPLHTVHPPAFQRSSGSGRPSDAGRRHLSDGSVRQLRRRTTGGSLLSVSGGLHETAKSPMVFGTLLPADAAAEPAAKQPLLQLSGDKEAAALAALALDLEGGGRGRGGRAAAADLTVLAGIKALVSNPHHAAFFATTFFMGIGYGFLGYEFLYLRESGAPGLLLGVCNLVSTCGEMPLFATSGWWLPKLGHTLAFNIGMAGWVLRLALYTLLPLFPSLWCVVPVELLQGLTFAVAYGVGMMHAKEIAPPHLRSTCTSLFFVCYYGLGPGVSGLAGGYIYESLGMRFVFIIGSCTLLVGWLLIQLALRWATRHERRAAKEAAALAP